MSCRGGSILKDGHEVMPIVRNGTKWHVDLKRIQCLVSNTTRTRFEKVYELHKRTGHASIKNMISAIQTKS